MSDSLAQPDKESTHHAYRRHIPQNEITADPIAVRDYAQAAEGLGYTHLLSYDHVVGADLTNRPHWPGPYSIHSLFHEPFVLYGYLAGLTQRLELVTGIVILPQRQTALVAKQAAEVDVLSAGRLRLGVGIGWNEVEYQALNEDFGTRGARSEEQIAVLRALLPGIGHLPRALAPHRGRGYQPAARTALDSHLARRQCGRHAAACGHHCRRLVPTDRRVTLRARPSPPSAPPPPLRAATPPSSASRPG